MNYLEQLLSEWYQYQKYFVIQNVKVEKRLQGGYDSELDIVAFNPRTNHLIHVETSMDTDSWAKREIRYRKKFDLGKKHIPDLFKGINITTDIEQRAVFMYASNKNNLTIGGGTVCHVSAYLDEMSELLKTKKVEKEIVPESFPLIRTIQIYIHNKKSLSPLKLK